MKQRILSGMRSTARLHLGNYEGALKNWVALQNDYELFAMIADWHALTTDYEDTINLKDYIHEVAIDYLSSGLNPEICTIFVQSDVKEHAELHLLFSMFIPTPWLLRNPTVKEQAKDLGLLQNEDDQEMTKINYGHLGYPVLQAADILIYKADFVPVGEDQLPHLELCREIARRFNSLYGNVFPEPQPKLTAAARLPGLDGKRMSKSLGNVIELADDSEVIRKKVLSMFTDPLKVYKGDKGDPKIRGCPVFAYQEIYNQTKSKETEIECKVGKLGCVDCKKFLAEELIATLAPLQNRRQELIAQPKKIEEILEQGKKKAQSVAQQTMEEVRETMHLRGSVIKNT
ncbi:MAG: tryptophan--tRNA ligase [Candidatus Edwardsbacteria bacterium]